jgi:predicted nucleic acid-binding protein
MFISYLLSSDRAASATDAILVAAALDRFILLFTAGVADEIRRTVRSRADLAARITTADVEVLLARVAAIGEMVPRLEGSLPAVSRDPKDDYLIAHAKAGRADYLVT